MELIVKKLSVASWFLFSGIAKRLPLDLRGTNRQENVSEETGKPLANLFKGTVVAH
jgi:hypothetical protein